MAADHRQQMENNDEKENKKIEVLSVDVDCDKRWQSRAPKTKERKARRRQHRFGDG
jgi:hypothetical protein